jgi:hypothetical protein
MSSIRTWPRTAYILCASRTNSGMFQMAMGSRTHQSLCTVHCSVIDYAILSSPYSHSPEGIPADYLGLSMGVDHLRHIRIDQLLHSVPTHSEGVASGDSWYMPERCPIRGCTLAIPSSLDRGGPCIDGYPDPDVPESQSSNANENRHHCTLLLGSVVGGQRSRL